ncbi:MAG: T9SS type A sorting domain-containing protein, partial [candidate division Zixibacteria bacterium]|nr:T9SS type A sorting domain-containing protein [candidate division Zixibacteria bacterium]
IIHIGNPDNPVLLGAVGIDAEVDNITIDGDYVYAAAGTMGLLIISVSDPFNPEIVMQWDTQGDTEGVVVRDSLVFISERHLYDTSRPFQILNVADINNPILVSYLRNDMGWSHDLIVDGDYAYLANSYRGLFIIDISNLAMPEIISQMEDITYPRNISKSGDYLFADSCFGVLQVIDVSHPEAPEIAVRYDMEERLFEFDISSDYLYIAGSVGKVTISDITDINNIYRLGEYKASGSISTVMVIGDYLYSQESGFGLHIHDLADPENPDEVASIEYPYRYTYVLREDSLYALGGNGLKIYDVSDPSSPVEAINYTLDFGSFDVCIRDSYLYFVSSDRGVSVYNRISSDSLEFIRSFYCGYWTFDAEIVGDIGYFSQNFALEIYDLSDPEDSVMLCSYEPMSGAGRLYYKDGFIYTQLEEGQCDMSVSIVDVSDPSNPANAAQLFFPHSLLNVHFNNDLAYFSYYRNGIHVYDISDPYDPVFICEYNTPGYITNIDSYNNYSYVADNSSLIVLRYTTTGIEPVTEIPNEYFLLSNYPNPFNSSTNINFNLTQTGEVGLAVYNLMGQRVETLIDGTVPPGRHNIAWDASGFSSGIYFYKLQVGSFVTTKKMNLLK